MIKVYHTRRCKCVLSKRFIMDNSGMGDDILDWLKYNQFGVPKEMRNKPKYDKNPLYVFGPEQTQVKILQYNKHNFNVVGISYKYGYEKSISKIYTDLFDRMYRINRDAVLPKYMRECNLSSLNIYMVEYLWKDHYELRETYIKERGKDLYVNIKSVIDIILYKLTIHGLTNLTNILFSKNLYFDAILINYSRMYIKYENVKELFKILEIK